MGPKAYRTVQVDMGEVARSLAGLATGREDLGKHEIEDLSKLAGRVAENVKRKDDNLEVTIRHDMATLIRGVLDYVHGPRSHELDPETRAAMASLAEQLAGELEAEAISSGAGASAIDQLDDEVGREPLFLDAELVADSALLDVVEIELERNLVADPEDDQTVRGELGPEVEDILKELDEEEDQLELTELDDSATDEREVVKGDSIPNDDPGHLQQFVVPPTPQPLPAPPYLPQPTRLESAAEGTAEIEEQPLATPAPDQDDIVADEDDQPGVMPPMPLVERAGEAAAKGSGNKRFFWIGGVLLLVIILLTIVAGYLAWKGGHLGFVQAYLPSR